MNIDQIQQLMDKLEASKLKKLVIKKGDFELQLEKEGEAPAVVHVPARAVPAETFHPEAAPSKAPKAKAEAEGAQILSPMVGTVYHTPQPGQPPFVKVGDRVDENTVVCIIEAMKVMNEIKAKKSGVITEVIAEHGHPVEFGQPLFRIQ